MIQTEPIRDLNHPRPMIGSGMSTRPNLWIEESGQEGALPFHWGS